MGEYQIIKRRFLFSFCIFSLFLLSMFCMKVFVLDKNPAITSSYKCIFAVDQTLIPSLSIDIKSLNGVTSTSIDNRSALFVQVTNIDNVTSVINFVKQADRSSRLVSCDEGVSLKSNWIPRLYIAISEFLAIVIFFSFVFVYFSFLVNFKSISVLSLLGAQKKYISEHLSNSSFGAWFYVGLIAILVILCSYFYSIDQFGLAIKINMYIAISSFAFGFLIFRTIFWYISSRLLRIF